MKCILLLCLILPSMSSGQATLSIVPEYTEIGTYVTFTCGFTYSVAETKKVQFINYKYVDVVYEYTPNLTTIHHKYAGRIFNENFEDGIYVIDIEVLMCDIAQYRCSVVGTSTPSFSSLNELNLTSDGIRMTFNATDDVDGQVTPCNEALCPLSLTHPDTKPKRDRLSEITFDCGIEQTRPEGKLVLSSDTNNILGNVTSGSEYNNNTCGVDVWSHVKPQPPDNDFPNTVQFTCTNDFTGQNITFSVTLEPPTETGLSTGEKIGIGIGSIVGVCGIVGASVYFAKKKQQTHHGHNSKNGNTTEPTEPPIDYPLPSIHGNKGYT